MKKIIIGVCAVICSISVGMAQVQKAFQIDYSGLIDGKKVETTPEGTVYLRAFVNANYVKVGPVDTDLYFFLSNKKSGETYIVVPTDEQYTLHMRDSYGDGIQVELIPGKTKTIAGKTCKLAQFKVPYSTEEGEKDIIELWYTEDIPSLYWPEFGFLKQLPGAMLELSNNGNGLTAHEISVKELDKQVFEIPDGYSEVNMEEATAEDEEEDSIATEVDEDRYLYKDENTQLVGLMDEEGNIISPAEFSHIEYFRGGISPAIKSEGKYGAIDKQGKTVLPFKYDYLSYDQEYDQYLYGEGEKYGFLNGKGEVLVPAKYDMVNHMIEGYGVVYLNEKSGIIDRTGKLVVPITHEAILETNGRNFVTSEGDQYVLYAINGNKMITKGYDLISLSVDSKLILVQKDEKYGYIDETGKVVIPLKYTSATAFNEGVAIVMENDDAESVYYINEKGERIEQ